MPPATRSRGTRAEAAGERRGNDNSPPKWRMERACERLGMLPRLMARALEALATVPVLGWVVRFFTSVWLGLTWLALIGVYIAIGSGFSNVRAHFELTDLAFFDAWPMQVLLALLCVTLVGVTLRRVPLTLFKLGVWTVHTGILVLVAGCVIYFSNKVEGLARIYLGKSTDAFYDATERALYVYRVGAKGELTDELMAPLPKLPIYHEHLEETGNPLSMAIAPVDLGRVHPGLEHVPVRIVGYYPYASLEEDAWGPGPKSDARGIAGIGVNLGHGAMKRASAQWMANTPAGRVLESGSAGFGVEYLYHPSVQRLAELTSEFAGSGHAVTVRIPKFNVEKTIALTGPEPIAIEGTPYTIKALGPMPPMSMASAGYEGASSASFRVEVTRKQADGKDFTFARQVLFRFPELSPDFVSEGGKQKRVQARVDHDIDIVYHNAALDQFWIVQQDKPAWTLIHRERGGKVSSRTIALGEQLELTVAGRIPLTMILADTTSNAVRAVEPRIVPERQRGRASNVQEIIQRGMVALQVGSGDAAQIAYAPFTEFADTTSPRGHKPATVDVPGVGKIGFVLSTTRRPLPAKLTLIDFKLTWLPGSRQFPIDYMSTFTATEETRTEENIIKHTVPLKSHLNNPAEYKGLSFFQAKWDGNPEAPEAERFTVLGVGNRPGLPTMLLGCVLMLAGVLYAFYVKPVLQNLKKQQLLQWSQER